MARLAILSLILVSAAPQDKRANVEVLFAPTGDKRILQNRIADEIGAAKKEVVVAMYQFTSTRIADALVRAKKRGIDVRVLIDGCQEADSGPWDDAIQALEKGGVSIRRVFADGNKKKGRNDNQRARFHHKFCVIDGERVIAGSYNWTVQGDEDNHENLLILTGKTTATTYHQRFEEIWKDDRIVSD